jgi:hypothetical protein
MFLEKTNKSDLLSGKNLKKGGTEKTLFLTF